MKESVFAKIGDSEQLIDIRVDATCPEGMITMRSMRPETGYWVACADGTWRDNRAELERQWAMSELARSDRCKTDDFSLLDGITREVHLKKVNDYREKLRNPHRSNHPAFPDPSWRPEWPEGVKRPPHTKSLHRPLKPF